MSTIRLQLLDTLQTRIEAAVPALSVYRHSPFALADSKCPAITIECRAGDDEEVAQSLPGNVLEWGMLVEISILTRGDNPRAQADPHEIAIHNAICADTRLGGLAIITRRARTRFELAGANGTLGLQTLVYEVIYRTRFDNLEQTA